MKIKSNAILCLILLYGFVANPIASAIEKDSHGGDLEILYDHTPGQTAQKLADFIHSNLSDELSKLRRWTQKLDLQWLESAHWIAENQCEGQLVRAEAHSLSFCVPAILAKYPKLGIKDLLELTLDGELARRLGAGWENSADRITSHTELQDYYDHVLSLTFALRNGLYSGWAEHAPSSCSGFEIQFHTSRNTTTSLLLKHIDSIGHEKDSNQEVSFRGSKDWRVSFSTLTVGDWIVIDEDLSNYDLNFETLDVQASGSGCNAGKIHLRVDIPGVAHGRIAWLITD